MTDKPRSLCHYCRLKCSVGGDILACGAYEPKKRGMLWRLVKKALFG